ncbi:hypothetical protein [Amycolatopsis sp. BJA-103]|uniref:hypothetical protein n=1 Tax=unclassified Amycolatopsis TaxID=2618356 RepID=UPI000C760631|nr:hypothetical protein [Amycolatopsis sp. BJA-103]AUI57254.1 hypothetical protein BKN51_02870 [Amycolatopsis sp. BJA-103]PNE15533.1 hypothetical protein B1H26_31255 [Amycolatopsis sp. BJA-103]
MANFSADPRAMEVIAEGYSSIAAKMYQICELGQDRVDLLLEACGDDEMGEEIKGNLHAPAAKIEGAFTSISTVVENQTNVTKGMAAQLAAAESANVVNVHKGLKR